MGRQEASSIAGTAAAVVLITPPLLLSRYTGPTWNRSSGITAWQRAIKERERERCKEELRSRVDLKNPEVTPEASTRGEGGKKGKSGSLQMKVGEEVVVVVGGGIKGRISRTSRFSSGGGGSEEEGGVEEVNQI